MFNLRSNQQKQYSKIIETTLKSIYEKRFFERIHNSKQLSYLHTKLKQNYYEENYLFAITYGAPIVSLFYMLNICSIYVEYSFYVSNISSVFQMFVPYFKYLFLI